MDFEERCWRMDLGALLGGESILQGGMINVCAEEGASGTEETALV